MGWFEENDPTAPKVTPPAPTSATAPPARTGSWFDAPDDTTRGAVGILPETVVSPPPTFADQLRALGTGLAERPTETLGLLAESVINDIAGGISAAGRLPGDVGKHFENIQYASVYSKRLKDNPLDEEARTALTAIRAKEKLDNDKLLADAKDSALLAATFAPMVGPLRAGATGAKIARAGSLAEKIMALQTRGGLSGAAVRLADRSIAGGASGGAYGYFATDGDWEAARNSAILTGSLFGVGPPIAGATAKVTGKAAGLAGTGAARVIEAGARQAAKLPGVSPNVRVALRNASLGTFRDRAIASLPDLLRRYNLGGFADELETARTEGSILAARSTQGLIKELRRTTGPLGRRQRVYSDDDYETIFQALETPGGVETLEPRLQQIALGVQDELASMGNLMQAYGIPTYNRKEGRFFNIVLRKNFMPHIIPDASRFAVGGELRNSALARIMKKLKIGVDEAEKKLDDWISWSNAEAPLEARNGFPSRAVGYARSLDLPGYSMKLPDVLELYLDRTARLVSAHRRLGRWRGAAAAADATLPETAQTVAPLGEDFGAPIATPVQTGALPEIGEQFGEAITELRIPGPQPPRRTVRRDGMYPTVRTLMSRVATPEAVDKITDDVIRAADTGGLTDLIRANPALADVSDELNAIFGNKLFSQGPPAAKTSSVGFLDFTDRLPAGYALPDPVSGSPDELFPELFAAINNSAADAPRKELMRKLALDTLGYSPEMSALERSMANLTDTVGRVEIISKLGLSAVSQLSQFATPIVRTHLRGSVGNLFKTWFKDPEAAHLASESGAILGNVVRDAENAVVGAVGADDFLRYTGFTNMDMRARAFAALQGASFAEFAAEKMFTLYRRSVAAGRPVAGLQALERKLLSIGIDPRDIVVQGGKLNRDQKLLAANTVAYDTNFWGDALSLPEFFRSPGGKLITQFKSFGYQQTKFVKKHVIDPWVKHGDLGPAMRMAVLMPLSGEIIADIKAFLRGRERTDDLSKRLIENIYYAGAFGVLADALMAAERNMLGLTSALIGPGIGHGVDVAQAFNEARKGNLEPLARQGLRAAPLAIPNPRLQAAAAMAEPQIEKLLLGEPGKKE